MTNCVFGWENWARGALIQASSQVTGLEASQLQNDQGASSMSWVTAPSVTSANLYIENSTPVEWGAFGLFNTNFTAFSTLRWRVGSRASLIEETAISSISPVSVGWTLPAGSTVTRAHTPSTAVATIPDSSGANWTEVAQNTARVFHNTSGVRQGLLMEPSRTNGFTNPRALGSTAGTLGSGGVLPASGSAWARPNTTSIGVIIEIIGAVTVNGLPGLRIRYHTNGLTTTGAGTEGLEFATRTSAPTAAPSQTHTGSAFVRLHAGSIGTMTSITQRTLFLDSTSAVVTSNSFTGSDIKSSITGTLTRLVQTSTATSAATITRVIYGYQLSFATGTIYDFTLDFIAPQLELGDFVTTPILPAPGATGTATRGVEQIEFPAFSPASSGTLYVERLIEAANTGATASAGAAALTSDGTLNNSVNIRLLRLTTAVQTDATATVSSSSTFDGNNTGSVTLGVPRREAVRFGSNLYQHVIDGSPLASGTGSATPTVSRLLVASGESVHYIRELRFYSNALSDSQLVAVTGTGNTLVPAELVYDSGDIGGTVSIGYRQSIVIPSSPVVGVAVRCDISDPLNPEGRLRAAQLFAGRIYRPAISLGINSNFTRQAETPSLVTRGGQEYPFHRFSRRAWSVVFPEMSDTDMWNIAQELYRVAVEGGNVLFIPFPAADNRAREAVFGRVSEVGAATLPYPSPDFYNWSITITERL